MEGFYIAVAIVVGAYLISEGLKNFGHPESKSVIDKLNEEGDHELIKETDVHHFMGISKEDAKNLVEEHPEIPHITINRTIYYPRAGLKKWLEEIGKL